MLPTALPKFAGITRREGPEGQMTDPGRVQTMGLDRVAPDRRVPPRVPLVDGPVLSLVQVFCGQTSEISLRQELMVEPGGSEKGE